MINMKHQFQLLSVLVFYFLYYSTITILAIPHLCPHNQSLLLLSLKEYFSIDEFNSYDCESSYPKTATWNKTINCCTWEGISCDKITGNVVELDLSCSQLGGGSIDFVSSLFGNFTHLTNLNLSVNSFSGEIPFEIFKLTELNRLDLSSNAFTIGPDIFKFLLTNFTKLSHIYLKNLNIISSIPGNLSSSLEDVQLDGNNLHGKMPENIFHLPKLKTLNLEGNLKLYGLLPSVEWNCRRTLERLELSGINLSGEIPDSFSHLNALKYLDLSQCGLNGSLSKRVFINMTKIETIILDNNGFLGSLPSFPGEMKHLNVLSLYDNSFSGTIMPSWLLSLSSLQRLDLGLNQLSGVIPPQLFSLLNLQSLFLGSNQFSGPIPPKISSLANLQSLYLNYNQLSGPVPVELCSLVNLQILDLSSNNFSGRLPIELSNLVNLQNLDLSSNNFSGHVDVDIFSNMTQLRFLTLSHNRLSLVSKNNSTLPESIVILELASCNIEELDFLPSAVGYLDLSMNNIQEVPKWLWSQWENITELNISYNSITHVGKIKFYEIERLDLRSNLFQGRFPQVPPGMLWMFISNNQFSGVIPSSIVCRLSYLEVLDVSNNRFSGSIPQCIGNMSPSLSVLDMRMNEFEGTIPTNISSISLTTLNLHGNHFEGNIPLSLATCLNLKVLDLGNNNLNDTFPSWLGVLPNLTVLSLRSNSFHGKIILSATSSFSKLQILDLSHNHFFGTLPPELFDKFSGMMQINGTNDSRDYIGISDNSVFYEDSTILVNKGIEVELVKILTTWTTIDLSSNNFEGRLPNSVGRLISIRQLNFSNNKLTYEIPTSIENLSVLESLDLSSNQLIGTIPTQLTTLGFLSKLNLSYNHLTGRIPSGPQFQTFGNDSYIGNDGLCGIPLSETCGGDQDNVLDNSDDTEFFDGFGWRCVLIGYSVGIVIGSWIGFFMIFIGKPAWFIRMIESKGYRIVMKRKKKISTRTRRKN